MATIKLFYQITISDTKTGKIIRRTRKKLSKSFVLQFLQYLEASTRHAYGAGAATVVIADTGNTGRSVSATSQTWGTTWALSATANDDTFGLVVGSSNAAEANTNYSLGTQIAEGAGAGQLNHGAHNWTTSAVVGANVDLGIQRTFINNSGGNVTIEEVGIYIKMTPGWFFCIVRDITGTVTVANGQTATVDYTIRTTV